LLHRGDRPTPLAMRANVEHNNVLHHNVAELRRGKNPRMAPWRKDIFLATARITADAADHVLPSARADRDHGVGIEL